MPNERMNARNLIDSLAESAAAAAFVDDLMQDFS